MAFFKDIPSGQVHEFQVHRQGEKPRLYELKLGDEAMQAPMVICTFNKSAIGDLITGGEETGERYIQHFQNKHKSVFLTEIENTILGLAVVFLVILIFARVLANYRKQGKLSALLKT